MISRHRSARDVERKRLVAYVRTQLTGKGLSFGLGEQVLYGTSPLERFFTALLFPIHESEEETDEDNGEWEQGDYDVSPGLATEMQGQPSIAMPAGRKRRYMPPSSVGISFFLTGENPVLRVFYHAVRYRQLKKRDESSGQFLASAWERIHFMDSGHEVVFEPHGLAKYSVLRDGNNDGCARIEAVWRPYQNGYLVTLTLSNQQRLEPDLQGPDYTRQRNETTLFEVELRCIIEAGVIGQYPSRNKALLSEEEKRIELRYKDVPIYAVGHGAAADWGENVEGRMEVRVDFIPELEVPQVTADTAAGNETVLQFAFLQKEDNPELIRSLQQFVDGYAVWVGEQCERAAGEAPEDREIALGMVQDQQRALERMQTGIALLEQDIKCRRAFAVMNQAMLMQWQVADNNKGSPKPAQVYQWRPFQLAFILMALESTARENSSERDTLDLIWFPTGGGKTEAYLGLMAFAFVLRRLLYPGSGAGTAAIMRYTLRLLTTQQFLRANRVMMALELIRRDAASFSSGLGDSPFSSGIWVGNATSPNHFEEARGLVERGMFSKLVLQACPWCDTPFKAENYVAGEHDFYFCCTHPECDFGRHPAPYNRLPCNVVDEALYKDPPTLLISTVDKFARFAWEARASVFLGG
ncbi:MAG: hypothetical protein KDI15_00950, partial [Thiothrix sp.]|nr:hypothetical protein [Thiothrix sp.]